MKRIIDITGFLIITAVMTFFVFANLIGKVKESYLFLVAGIPLALFLVFGFWLEYKTPKDEKLVAIKKDLLINNILFALASGISYYCVKYLKFDGVIVASSISLVGGLLLKKGGAEITIGAFLGMGAVLFKSPVYFIVAILLAIAINFLTKDLFKGFGGKLGTISFSASIIVLFFLNTDYPPAIIYRNLDLLYVIIIIFFGAFITNILNIKLKLGPIVAYGIVSLVGALVFTNINQIASLGLHQILFAASFIGMSSEKRHPNIFPVMIACFVFFVLIIISKYFSLVGGRGGITALISVLVADSMYFLIKKAPKMKINEKKDNFN